MERKREKERERERGREREREREERKKAPRQLAAAPRSTSISTSLRPTKPIPPVTTHRLGTAGNRVDAPMVGTGLEGRVGSRGSATAPHRPSRSLRPSEGHAPQRHAGRVGRRCLWTMHSEPDRVASREETRRCESPPRLPELARQTRRPINPRRPSGRVTTEDALSISFGCFREVAVFFFER